MENMKNNELCIKAPDKETARKILQIITECTNLTDLFYEGEPVKSTVRFQCDDCDGCEVDVYDDGDFDDFFDKVNGIREAACDSVRDLDKVEDALTHIEDEYFEGEKEDVIDAINDAFELVDSLVDRLLDLEDSLSELKYSLGE